MNLNWATCPQGTNASFYAREAVCAWVQNTKTGLCMTHRPVLLYHDIHPVIRVGFFPVQDRDLRM